MKKILYLIIIFNIIIIFSSCDTSSVTVIGSDGKSYNFVSDKNGEIASDSAGNIIVERQDENGNTVTEVLTEKYLIIDNNSLKTPSYDYEIPEDFDLKSVGSDPLIENKQGTIQFNIMDKTESVSDFDEYVLDTYNAAVSSGIAKGDVSDVDVAGISMKRFELLLTDDDGSQLVSYAYIVKVDNRVLMITVTSKDGGITDVSQADAFVAEINFNSR